MSRTVKRLLHVFNVKMHAFLCILYFGFLKCCVVARDFLELKELEA